MMNSNLNLAKLPECVCEMRYIDSALLTPCAEYQRVLRTRKVEEISATFSEYVANEPRVSYRDGRYHVFDGQNTIEARIACNGGHDLPILCKVFHGLSKKDEALLFAVQTGISTDLTAGERLRADIVAEDEDACAVDIKTAEQVAIALGCKVDDAFDVETIAKPMTRKSMREYALFIRSTLEYADENYGVKNPMHKIPALGSRSRSVDTIKKHQIKQLQDTLKESSMLEQVIVLSLLNSGVRRGELAGLTWKDVNFEECTIHISKSLLVFKDFGYQLTTTKESNIRDVDVAPEYMDFLKEYYKYWKSQKKLMGGSWQKSLDKKSSKYAPSLLALRGTDFVICNDHGFPINPDSYGALVRRIGQRAGIEGLHPHMFRHTFVSILLSNPEIGVATVAAEAGHAQPSTTLAIYTQVYDKRRKEIRNQMSKELYE